jgi:hypothetical protein
MLNISPFADFWRKARGVIVLTARFSAELQHCEASGKVTAA